MISLKIPLEPVPSLRPRFNSFTKTARKPAKCHRFENEVAHYLRAQFHNPPLTVPVRVTFRFYLRRPKRPEYKTHPGGRPDLDNLIKAVQDAGTGILWRYDTLVCEYGPGTGKRYGEPPRIEIEIDKMEDEK